MAEKPALVITVDTEADNEWDHGRSSSYANIEGMVSFQQLCQECGAKPTYLVTYDVASQSDCAQVLREVSSAGQAEIGAHLHPWSTPPFDKEPPGQGHAYLYEYAPETQRAKLEHLTERLTEVFEHRPTSYRAGRWGLDENGLGLLQELGYEVDTSVVPLTSFRRNAGRTMGGSDFFRCPRGPYYPDTEDLRRPGDSSILEVPVSVGAIGVMAQLLEMVLRSGISGADYVRRAFRKAHLASVVKVQPVDQPLAPMIELADTLLQHGAAVLNISLHSSEWKAGYSPTVSDEFAEQDLHERMRAILDYLRPHVRGVGLSEFAVRWGKLTSRAGIRTPE